ncbi:hypothetical protein [Rhodobacter ferrooxidans]|uniref:Uncharacterized protein n=1 Tax=Rhodobacter ferrooxidans TaxID=371731 RepID=C8RXH9_9RHOB|nr:hypothetical protein [Rhodobacter sp. SW2]EEW26704.1 conserved hypothetical protein [Rhodobacter sp. SW2]
MSILTLLTKILFVGQSLVGPDLPPLVQAGLAAMAVQAEVRSSDSDAASELARGGTDVLVLMGQSDADTSLAAMAWAANPQAQVFVTESWPSLTTSSVLPWREQLTADLPGWQAAVATTSAARPPDAEPVRLIPAGQALGLAADAIATQQVPGLKTLRDLFADDIHPNGKGRYLLAMLHLAAITGQSPEGLPPKLTRAWQSRDSVIGDATALALQRIAWAAVQAQDARQVTAPAPKPVALAGVSNPALALGLAGINDWSVQQPFLDVMKTARPWVGHLPGQWGGMENPSLVAGGWLDAAGWPKAVPPKVTGLATLILTDLPEDAGGVAGRYLLRYQGKGTLKLEGRAADQQAASGEIRFTYTPGEGAVILTLTATDAADPLRGITVVREDRQAAFDAGAIFNPDWLDRIRGARGLRFMDWMATNDSTLAKLADRPKPDDFTYARNGVPVEVMLALANELQADPWFTLPHLAEDALVRFYAEAARDSLAPGLRAWVEYSNEVWNGQFAQSRWAAAQAKARWGNDQAGVQFYGLRAAQVAEIWAQVFGAQAKDRLVRVIATQTGWLGLEDQILDAPLLVAEGGKPPVQSFDAYAVTGYFSALLGSDFKTPQVRQWLAESQGAAKDAKHRYDRAIARAAAELRDGSETGDASDSLAQVLGEVLPHHAAVASARGLRLVMYEGGSHVVGYGAEVEDADLTAFFQALNYSPEMGALYDELLAGWARLTDAPFNGFVDVYRPTKWGSWGALRHLGDDNPRWRALALGCSTC